MSIFRSLKSKKSTFLTAICIGILQLAPNLSHANICLKLFQSQDPAQLGLEKAYAHFLESRNQAFSKAPKEIVFKGERYKVIDVLGDGLESHVLRVEGPLGKRKIMKIFNRYQLRSFPVIIWNYYRMNKHQENLYSIEAVDFKNKIFLFDDMRGIPLNRIGKILQELKEEEAYRYIYKRIAMEKTPNYYEQNVVFDIDRKIFIAIDPH